jgi:hypothetical protein
MPMIDIYAAAATFTDTHKLATDAAALIKAVEGVPDIAMFRKNTVAFIHEMPRGTMANVDGDENYVRVQVLTGTGALTAGGNERRRRSKIHARSIAGEQQCPRSPGVRS